MLDLEAIAYGTDTIKKHNFGRVSNVTDELNKEIHQVQQVLWVGIGCKRGTSWQLFDQAIEQVFRENQLFPSAIAGIATIDTKASEVGLVELCHLRNLPLKTFSA